jgi:tight adherence protein C
MLILIIVLVFATTALMVQSILSFIKSDERLISNRLSKIVKTKSNDAHDELNLPLYTRVLKPIFDEISMKISNLMPSEIKQKIERQLMQAGNPFGFTVNKWIGFQALLLIGMPAFTLLVAISNNANIMRITLVVVIEVILGLLMPRFILKKKITERKNEIVRTLPDVLDLITVSVEAGLGFDAALSRVVDKVPGQLSNEFTKVIQEIKVGTPRKEALKNMSKRVGVPDLTTFIGSIIQADQLGVGIGNVLRIQSQQLRQKRRQRAQEKAMKAPVKMLFPMVFFIFPTIFAVLLGPIVIKLMQTFGPK